MSKRPKETLHEDPKIQIDESQCFAGFFWLASATSWMDVKPWPTIFMVKLAQWAISKKTDDSVRDTELISNPSFVFRAALLTAKKVDCNNAQMINSKDWLGFICFNAQLQLLLSDSVPQFFSSL